MNPIPAPLVVRDARPADWPAVAAWTFDHIREPFAGLRADRLVGLLVDGEIPSAGVLVATRSGTAVGGITVQYLAGGTAVVLLPGGETEAVRDALVAETVSRFAAAGLALGQAFVDPAEQSRAAVLLRHGFRFATAVVHLTLDAPAKALARPGPPVRFVHHADADPTAFADTLLATYRDSLDVPEANVGRTAGEIVAGYRGTQSTPPNWWLATDPDGAPVGVLLLSDAMSGTTELAYLGVVPEARGRGVGGALLRLAIALATVAGYPITLTCDERNVPALRLYESAGFRANQRQLVYLWRGG